MSEASGMWRLSRMPHSLRATPTRTPSSPPPQTPRTRTPTPSPRQTRLRPHPAPHTPPGPQADAIAASDGMIGLNFAVNFLREDAARDERTPLEVMVRQIDYLVDRVGIDRVGFGSDFDGVLVSQEIGDVLGLPRLMSALRVRGYDDQ